AGKRYPGDDGCRLDQLDLKTLQRNQNLLAKLAGGVEEPADFRPLQFGLELLQLGPLLFLEVDLLLRERVTLMSQEDERRNAEIHCMPVFQFSDGKPVGVADRIV